MTNTNANTGKPVEAENDWHQKLAERIEKAMQIAVSKAQKKKFDGPTLPMFAKELAKLGVSISHEVSSKDKSNYTTQYGMDGKTIYGSHFRDYLPDNKSYAKRFLHQNKVKMLPKHHEQMKAYNEVFPNIVETKPKREASSPTQESERHAAQPESMNQQSQSSGPENKAASSVLSAREARSKDNKPENSVNSDDLDGNEATNNDVVITGKPHTKREHVSAASANINLTENQRLFQLLLNRTLNDRFARKFDISLPVGQEINAQERSVYGEAFIHISGGGKIINHPEQVNVTHASENIQEQEDVARLAIYAALEKGWDIETLEFNMINPKLHKTYEKMQKKIMAEIDLEYSQEQESVTETDIVAKINNNPEADCNKQIKVGQQRESEEQMPSSAAPDTTITKISTGKNTSKSQELYFGKILNREVERGCDF